MCEHVSAIEQREEEGTKRKEYETEQEFRTKYWYLSPSSLVQSYSISTVHYLFSCDKAIEGGYINKCCWALSSGTLVSCILIVTASAHWRLSQNWAVKLSLLPGVFCYLIREGWSFLWSCLCAHVSGLQSWQEMCYFPVLHFSLDLAKIHQRLTT